MADLTPQTPASPSAKATADKSDSAPKKAETLTEKLEASAASAEGADAKAGPKVRRKKIKKSVPQARVCIHAGENNTIVTFTDLQGNKLGGCSAGMAGFKGTRKSTPYAAKVAAEKASELVQGYGIQSVTVEVKGLGPGREQSIRGLQSAGLNLDAIVDTTPIPHGGVRQPGRRRV
ncbi:MAG TPA: 30S ribosomal protein S11 [Candidatus Peribacter riflensis]|uniref:Small ribosomal subunit protein uS11 n=1 Tax=Candidatus Peribacter riflensis TaxID=1735162 RepID=A0A0S1SJR0_9BACT|nr:MAG: small subunit ribosomal protein S11 [Candidatus Peribacter riflensis]ALM10533.1 MAG: small subunit ribosomal protein S11 [Candidatus Peribacter riflensis]ALM11636.1 MAG: small subunit ribosomal protein S11 [Candidatus Peribacter riflensis]ALM12738.1 MAG: small subunit ribosomal protein S11 [Candidatus Peribacter riflensis]ALM13839.1 MAG: small subunit ribosomal protein S11 [Candidatus Peribacter riflensis]